MNFVGDQIIEKIGGHGRYQILVVTMICLIAMVNGFFYFYFTLMETPPVVRVFEDGKESHKNFDYSMCGTSYEINTELTKHTFVYVFDLYCDKVIVSMLGVLLGLGCLTGTILIKFIQHWGVRKLILISTIGHCIATGLLYFINTPLLMISIFIYGVSYMIISMLKTTIITEITDSKYRSYFMNGQFSSAILTGLIYYFTFDRDYDWRWVYLSSLIFMLMMSILFFFFSVESPRFYLNMNDKDNLVNSMLYISKINKQSLDLDQAQSLLDTPPEINDKDKNDFSLSLSPEVRHKINKTILIHGGVTYIFYGVMMMLINFEIKFYTNEMPSYGFYLISVLAIFTFTGVSWVMNFKVIGRKWSAIGVFAIVIILRIVKLTTPYQVQTYLPIRLIAYTAEIPAITLVLESFPAKMQVTYFGYISLVSQFISSGSLFALEYLNQFVYDYTMIGLAIMLCVSIFIHKETVNSSIRDS
jgi:hypothetical protein